MTTVAQLRNMGFRIELVPEMEGVTKVWHELPFRHFDWRQHCIDYVLEQSIRAEPDASGDGYSFIQSDSWRLEKNPGTRHFFYGMIFEESIPVIEAAQKMLDDIDEELEDADYNDKRKNIKRRNAADALHLTLHEQTIAGDNDGTGLSYLTVGPT